MNTEPNMRRSTAQIRKLLRVVEDNYTSIMNSKRYAQMSEYRNRDRFVRQVESLENSWWVARSILRWVLMEGFTAEELKHLPVEMEDALEVPHEEH